MDMVIVFRTFSGSEAHLVRSRLEAAGIPASVMNENSALTLTGGGSPAAEIRVEVSSEFAAGALELIEASRHEK